MFDTPNTTLTNARIRAGLSVEDVLKELNVHPNTYRNWEHGLGCPNRDSWNKLIALLGNDCMDNFRIKPSGEEWTLYNRLCEANVAYMQKETLKEIRMRLGISQARMALIFNVSMLTWHKWENGITLPSAPLLELIVACFGPIQI